MTPPWKKLVILLLTSLLVTSACQSNSSIPLPQTSNPELTESPPNNLVSNPSPTEYQGSSCGVTASSSQSVAFPPLPASLSVSPIQETHPVGSNWGIGFLIESREESSNDNLPEWNPGYEWFNRLRLPLYDSPQGNGWGWIACGWLVDGSASEPQISQLEPSLLQTSYETYSFIVLREQADGWFQVRYGSPTSSHHGVAWAHRSHLELGDRPLKIQYWQDIFQPNNSTQTRNRGWLQFRDDTPSSYQHLKQEPTSVSENIAATDGIFIHGGYGIETLEIQENWMRVRVSIPQDYCIGSESSSAESIEFYEGWIQWWTPDQGTLLYYPARGC